MVALRLLWVEPVLASNDSHLKATFSHKGNAMTETTNDRRPQHQTAGSETDPSAHDDTGIVDTVVSAVKGEDEPMEESHPRATPALVFLTYPMLLFGLLIIVAIAFWLFGGFFGGGEVTQ
jgi:hypothetical protein